MRPGNALPIALLPICPTDSDFTRTGTLKTALMLSSDLELMSD
jgi:hypothetical protein